MQDAAQLNIRRLRQFPEHPGTCVIVGGAPSVADNLEKMKSFIDGKENIVCSINCVHPWLIQEGIIPNIHVVFEPDINLKLTLGEPHKEVVYYICSHCPQPVFEGLNGHKRVLWHYWDQDKEYEGFVADLFPGEFMVGGGYSTLFRTINIALLLGYRSFELFGVDSSFEDDEKQHLPNYPTRPSADAVDFWVGECKFRTLGALALQAEMIQKFCEENADRIKVRVHGYGLLPTLLQQRSRI